MIELREIKRQMLFADLVKCSDNSALQEREAAFNGVRVRSEIALFTRVLFPRMLHWFVREDSRHWPITEIIIRAYNRAVLDVLHDRVL